MMFVFVKHDKCVMLNRSQNIDLEGLIYGKSTLLLASYEQPCHIALPQSMLSSFCDRYNKRGAVALFLTREPLGLLSVCGSNPLCLLNTNVIYAEYLYPPKLTFV